MSVYTAALQLAVCLYILPRVCVNGGGGEAAD